MQRRWKILLAAGGVAGTAGVGLFAARAWGEPPLEVEIATVRRGDIVSLVLANGKVQPRRKVDISASIPGQIVNLAIREGDVVERGTFLLQIDRAQYLASARSSEANLEALLHDRDAALAALEKARYDFEKAQRSIQERLIPETEHAQARAALAGAEASWRAAVERVEQARAGLEGAKDSLNKTTILAPIGGVVTSLPIREGEVAVIGTMNNPGTVLLTLSDLSEVDADLAVDETDLPRLRVGQPARVRIEPFPGLESSGVVSEIGSSPIRQGTDAAIRTGTTTTEAIDFEVKVSISIPPAGVRPGFSVTAEIEVGRASEVPLVPLQALVTRDKPAPNGDAAEGARESAPVTGEGSGGEGRVASGGARRKQVEEGLYRVRNGKAEFVPVRTGLSGAVEIEILEGIVEGDEIIVGPFRALREIRDQMAVRRARNPGAET